MSNTSDSDLLGIFFANFIDDAHRAFVILLAEHGWYITDAMPFSAITELRLRLSGDSEKVDQLMASYYENNMDAIATYFQQKSPHRTAIISQALQAHKAGLYYLSILGFLAQADGFCFDADLKLFERHGQKNHIAEVAKSINDGLPLMEKDSLLAPIASKKGLISLSQTERAQEGRVFLNRHSAMHGEDLAYGTYLNSLKAFSCMAFYAGYVDYYRDMICKQLVK